jgi:hypothetical protein
MNINFGILQQGPAPKMKKKEKHLFYVNRDLQAASAGMLRQGLP